MTIYAEYMKVLQKMDRLDKESGFVQGQTIQESGG